MDGAEVATNCACTTRSCPTCWCPDNMLSSTQNTHKYRRVAEVLSELDSAREELLDDDGDLLPGCVGDAKAAEKRIRHKLLPRNAWMLVPYFELFMSCPKDELHQWYECWDIPISNWVIPYILWDILYTYWVIPEITGILDCSGTT